MSDYVPKPDLENVNSPEVSSPIKDLAILLSGFLGIVVVSYFALIQVSDWALTKLSLESEIKVLGKVWSAASSETKNHPDLDSLVNKLNQHVSFPLNVSVICDESPNAMALPGGKIFLTSGLLKEIKTENGLVFVLGHEIGHFTNRDHIRGLGRQVIFGLGASLMGFGDIGSMSSINQFIARTYDRTQESSADSVGLSLLEKIYSHTWGAEEFFVTVAKNESGFEKAVSKFVSTHPPSQDRIDRIKETQQGEPQTLILPKSPYSEWSNDLGCT